MKKLFAIALTGLFLTFSTTSVLAAVTESSLAASSVGIQRASWGETTITYANDGTYAKATSSTYAGNCYYISAKVTSTYSNGQANGPSDFSSKYNAPSVATSNVYENGAYRQYTANGVFQDTSSSGNQYATVSSPVFK